MGGGAMDIELKYVGQDKIKTDGGTRARRSSARSSTSRSRVQAEPSTQGQIRSLRSRLVRGDGKLCGWPGKKFMVPVKIMTGYALCVWRWRTRKVTVDGVRSRADRFHRAQQKRPVGALFFADRGRYFGCGIMRG